MAKLNLDFVAMDDLQQAMKDFQGNTEEIINDVLHNEAGELVQDAIQRLMPVSGKTWNGKKKAAKYTKSMMNVNENLALTVKSKTAYNYLYFPDDGSNTKNHAGNQQFFKRGGESQINEIMNRCLGRLVNDLEE